MLCVGASIDYLRRASTSISRSRAEHLVSLIVLCYGLVEFVNVRLAAASSSTSFPVAAQFHVYAFLSHVLFLGSAFLTLEIA
jgi:hypothetical protein